MGLNSVAGQPRAILSAFVCTQQGVDLETVSSLGFFFEPVPTSSRTVLRKPTIRHYRCSALRASPRFPKRCAHSITRSASCWSAGDPAAFFLLSPLVPAWLLPEVQQEQPGDHALQGAHSEHPTFTCPKLGKGVCQHSRGRQGSWCWQVAQLGPGRVGRAGSWQALAAPPELLPTCPEGGKGTAKPWRP